jgi:preprotein translocase subunit SecA
VEELHSKGQPVLVGTTSIDKNEIIAELLKRKGIPHQVLNAKNHEKEAGIIAQAGAPGAVTVATNIAGRGVDIVLGGGKPSAEQNLSKKELDKLIKEWQGRHDEVLKAGGLYIIGTERHESRRIDNQLRGRSGRQGDPGASRFFVALNDDIMRLFGGEQVANLMTALKLPEDQPIESGLVSKSIEQAQVKVEGFHFDQRKHLVEYDDVMNKQREIIYELRQRTLGDYDFKNDILNKSSQEIEKVVQLYSPKGFVDQELNQLVKTVAEMVPMSDGERANLRSDITRQPEVMSVEELLKEKVLSAYETMEKEVSKKVMRDMERAIVRMVIDHLWVDHLDAIDDLRQGIGLRGYGQRDPLNEYKQEAFSMFEGLMGQIDYQVIRRILRAKVAIQMAQPGISLNQAQAVHESANLEQEAAEAVTLPLVGGVRQPAEGGTGSSKSIVGSDLSSFATAMSGVNPSSVTVSAGKTSYKGSQQAVVVQKIGRNDLCWCGSGKKFKKCHYPEMPG